MHHVQERDTQSRLNQGQKTCSTTNEGLYVLYGLRGIDVYSHPDRGFSNNQTTSWWVKKTDEPDAFVSSAI
jgi:hypothetical protein